MRRNSTMGFIPLFLFTVLIPAVESKADDKKSGIKFPELKLPDPVIPTPGPVTSLPADQLYVIRNDTKLLILGSPKGRVSITEIKGPYGIAGRFVDGSSFEFRRYEEPFIYLIKPASKGPVELLVIPELDESKVITIPLDVLGGGELPETLSKLQKAINDAYKEETAEDKALLYPLVSFYTVFQTTIDSSTTWVGLFKLMGDKAKELKINGRLLKMQEAIAGELGKVFPSGDLAPTLVITAEDKVKAKETLDKVVNALKKVK